MKNVFAPSLVLNPPEIFCFTLAMRSACFAKLLVNGTSFSQAKRHTSSRYLRSRVSKLNALLCANKRPLLPVDFFVLAFVHKFQLAQVVRVR